MRWAIRLGGYLACVLALASPVPSAIATESAPRVSAPRADDAREDSIVVALFELRARVPEPLVLGRPGLRRLVRERLAHDPGFPMPSGPLVFDELLPDGARLPIAANDVASCPQCPEGTARALVAAAAGRSTALALGNGGLRLELAHLAWTREAGTAIVDRQASNCVAGRRQEGNPEFERLKVRLMIELADRNQAEEDSRNESGFLGLLASLRASITEGEVRRLGREVERTPPFLWTDVVEPYTIDVTEARAVGTLTALALLSDPATGWRDTLQLSGTSEQRARGLRGVRAGDLNSNVERDAEAALPPEAELYALAFADLGARAVTALEASAARAALRRALREQDLGRGGEALGWLLLARDCGGRLPEASGWRAALARAHTTPYARLATVPLGSLRTPAR